MSERVREREKRVQTYVRGMHRERLWVGVRECVGAREREEGMVHYRVCEWLSDIVGKFQKLGQT